MFDRDQPSFKNLLSSVRRSATEVVPFVGPGLFGDESRKIDEPQWLSLLTRLQQSAEQVTIVPADTKDRIASAIRMGEHIRAFDELQRLLGPVWFVRETRAFIEETEATKIPALVRIVAIAWSLIVTTNLDRRIEQSWRELHQEDLLSVTSHDLARGSSYGRRDASAQLLKTHGTIERPDSWILSPAHFRLHLERNQNLREFLRQLFLHTILLIGYGESRYGLDVAGSYLREVVLRHGVHDAKCYLLARSHLRGDRAMDGLIRDYGVQPIWYSPSIITAGHHGHDDELTQCLDLLIQAWSSAAHPVPVKLKYFPELEPQFVGRVSELEALKRLIGDRNVHGVQVVGFGGEGKTSLIQKLVQQEQAFFAQAGFEVVFGCSFYAADVSRFIDDAYLWLVRDGRLGRLRDRCQALCNYLSSHRILLVLDGFEALQHIDGRIRNPQILQILQATLYGSSSVLITTRVPVRSMPLARLDLEPMPIPDALMLLRAHGVHADSEALGREATDIHGIHAYSLRMAASLIAEGPRVLNERSLGKSLLTEDDDFDPIRANKARRICQFYERHLSAAQLAFLRAFSVFRRPVPMGTILAVFSQDLGAESITHPLQGHDLRVLIHSLRDLRLLMTEDARYLTCHPLVRTFFAEGVREEDSVSFYRALATHYERDSDLEQWAKAGPDTFENAAALIEICYYSALCGDWSRFHLIFREYLNRGYENFLGTSIGAWQEFYDLARLPFVSSKLDTLPVIEPVYYNSAVARGLSNLGRNREALAQYFQSIDLCLSTKDDEAAREINNMMIILVDIGEVQHAVDLIPANVAAAHWIREDWRRCWQLEHGCFTFGSISALLGKHEDARFYHGYAATVWSSCGLERQDFFDACAISEVDLCLAGPNPDIDRAEKIVELELERGKRRGWRDTLASGLLARSAIYRARLSASPHDISLFERARDAIFHAQEIASGGGQPDLIVAVRLELLRLLLLHEGLAGASGSKLPSALDLAQQNIDTITTCDMRIYSAETLAAQALICLQRGAVNQAQEILGKALAELRFTGDRLTLSSKNRLFYWAFEEVHGRAPEDALLPDIRYEPATRCLEARCERDEVRELLRRVHSSIRTFERRGKMLSG